MNKSTFSYLLFWAIFSFAAIPAQAQQFFFSAERPSSCAANDGILTIVPMRGVPPFTYAWNTGTTDVSLRNVPKGLYSATMTDASGATVVHSHYLNSEALDLRVIQRYPAGGCDPNTGGFQVEALDGQAPYTYSWSNGQSGATVQGFAAGQYTVTVQDANGCTAEGSYEVGQLTGPYFVYADANVREQPDCANLNNGEVQANLNYSSYFPVTYLWSNGATGQSASNLTSGTYTITATDALGCSSSVTVEVKNKLDIVGNVICSGGNTGTLDAELINAAAPVNYVWDNGQTGAHLSNLANGYYSLTATDAAGCTAVNQGFVAEPFLYIYDSSPNCFSGNQGSASVWVSGDVATSYLWDNGSTDSWATDLSPGLHSVTVTSALGCALTNIILIKIPLGPAITFNSSTTAADCSNNLGGSITLSAQGGNGTLNFSIYGPDGFVSSDINGLQNVQSGEYSISAYTLNYTCYGNTSVHVPDQSGFEPALEVSKIDCSSGYGSAAILNVTSPNAQYEWSNGNTSNAMFNLTEGYYSVTVSAGASCVKYYEFWMYSEEDSLHNNGCSALATGKLFNDLGVPGCNGTQGIPYQMIRTLPSGALNFTDEHGDFNVNVPTGSFELEAALYDPADIPCPANGKHSFNAVSGNTISGLDFHFLNNNAIDHRVRQRALRTAQPGYPYSLRLEVCNDGANANPGTLDLQYGNFLGAATGHHFAQHPAAFVLGSETTGIPNNGANFNFPAIAPGACELLQLDLLTPTTTALNTAFVSDATVSPASGDPTPANNRSVLYNTVAGAFDPNSVLAYPARNGNPHDGGEIVRFEDNTIIYQIFFQNTGNAAADQVIVRDLIDPKLNLETIRNIQATHDMKVSVDQDGKTMVFRFDNINLPDSTSDYAGSIGSIQYEIDVLPGIDTGAKIQKRASIYFDFNAPVATNQNVLEVVNSSKVNQLVSEESVQVFPNPADGYFGFYCVSPSVVSLYNSLGQRISQQKFEGGLQQISSVDLPAGIYMLQLDSNGKIRNGKVVISH